MLELSSLHLRTDYRKGRDDIAQDFYLPCMRTATRYDRAVGFFNSAIYIIAWPSLRDFVSRNGKMRLICSPVLPPSDIDAIETGYSDRFDIQQAEQLRDDIRHMLGTPYLYKPATVLATLVALEVVDVRIAFVRRSSGHERLFHEKLGLFRDAFCNTVAFKGSMNETWAGLSADGNLESVDVFLSWEDPREAMRVEEHQAYFEALWKDECRPDGVVVKRFPEIARSELIRGADVKRWPELVDEICRELEAAERFDAARQALSAKVLRPHQVAAILEWEQRGRRGILQHATGSGKTFTAICALRESLSRQEVPLVLVPSELLLEQWSRELANELSDLQPQILKCGAGNTKWREDRLLAPWTRAGSDRARIVLSTMQTAVSTEFVKEIRQGSHVFVVADEVHRTGSPSLARILDFESGPRMGLSATPERAGDDAGTARIFDYFQGVVPPPFTLRDAIEAGTLTPYVYHVHTVLLTESEQEDWDDLTRRIRQLVARAASSDHRNGDADFQIKRLLIDRSRIQKQAAGKAGMAARIVTKNFHGGDRWLVYCDDLEQVRSDRAELSNAGLASTEYHSTMEGDKEQTIRLFEANGGVMVSIKCLDEGVDIPSVSHALILASSRNPREYVQRRGRVLRRFPGKSVAHIHDVLVLPAAGTSSDDVEDPRLNMLLGELIRSVEFAKSALNPAAMADLELIAARFAKDFRLLLNAGYEDDE